MTHLTTLVLLFVMVDYSSTYWIIWRSSPQTNLGHDIETPPQSGDCSGQLTKVECRVLYTRQTIDEFDSKFFPFADKKCSLTGGLFCVASSTPCPADFEIRYFCSDLSVDPNLQRSLANGPRWRAPGETARAYCRNLLVESSDYNVVENNGTFSLVSAPDVLNYGCTISVGDGAYINLGGHMTSCTSDPGQCPGGQSTWSIWMKLNHADNPGLVTFLSSGTGSNTGVSFSRLLDGNFEVAVNIRSAQWLRSLDDNLIPDGVWFHLVIVIDTTASTQLDVYIDGTQQGVFSSIDGISTTATPTLATPFLTLGGTSGSDGQRDATSAFSDFMIFETKLTTTKIKNLHECGVVVNPRETQIKEVWNILQLEVSNPNELGYRCVLQSMERPGGGDVAWYLYLHGNNKIPLSDRALIDDLLCFYKSELLINKYNDLVQRGCTSNCKIMCEFRSSSQLYQTRNIAEADLIYEWTPWLSSSSPRDNPVGDNETLAHLLQVYPVDGCAYPVRIECRERYTMKTPEYLRDREGVTIAHLCDLNEGLLCLNSDNAASAPCPDFEVRFICAGKRNQREITHMSVRVLSSQSLQVECQADDENITWGLYNISSYHSTELIKSPGDISIHTYYKDGHWVSNLTIENPFSKNLMGLFVICNVSCPDDEGPPVYDSLRIDTVFYGTVSIISDKTTPVVFGSAVRLTCNAVDDVVHSVEWNRMPLNSVSYANSKRIDSTPYVRDSYMGGTLSLDIPDFQSEHVGVYLCVINWWSAVANVTLEGPETTTSAPTTSAPTTSAPMTSAPTTSAPTTSAPTTSAPTTSAPTTSAPTTSAPTTLAQMATQRSTSLHTSPELSVAPETDPSGTVHTFSPGPSTLQSRMMPSSTPTPAEPITAGEETIPATSPSVEGATGGKITATTVTKDDLSHTEGPLTTDALPTVTPSWCALGDVHTLQEAIACGKTSRIDVEPGKLTDDKKVELVNFLKFVVSQPTHQELKTYSETAAVTKTVLMVFTKLTDADQNLSVQEEAEIVADTEEALKVLAGTLLPKTCATLGYDGSSVSLCNSPALSLLSGYTFTHQVPISYDDSGDVITTFEESAEFDLSKMDLDAKNVSAVILRKMRPSYMIDQIKFWESTDNLQAPNETWIQLNSALLTLSLFVQGNRTSVPVTFSLYHLENLKGESRTGESATVNISKNSICAFVDDKDDQNVQWSAYGCKAVSPRSTNEHTYCSCNHSTNFAVLMQVKSYEISHADSLALTWITYIGCSTSMVMLVLMLAVFLYLGRMLRSDRSFIHTNLSVAILVAQILFIAGIDRTENRGICKAIALLLHFCYLSVFAWMLVEGVHLYMKVVKVYGSENIKMYPYLFIGWGIPLVITLISFGASNDGYGTGNSCWLDTSSGLIWAFVAPALLVIMINLIVLAMVVRIVIKSAHLRQEKKYDHIKAGIKGALTLLPLLGLTWVFGLLAVNSATILFQYLFTIFNSFQGLFIFLINCVFNSEVKTAFVRKREKQKLAHERDTLEHSMSFVYSSKKATSADNSSNTRHQPADEHTRKEQCTDLTSLRSDSPSSRPGSGTALLDVTQRKHLKRPHSGKVSPMPIKDVDDLETI